MNQSATRKLSTTNGTPPTQTKSDSTSVKISTSGLELSGYPTWIIWVVLAVAVVAFVLWFFLLRSDKGPSWLLIGTVGIAGIFFLASMFFVGNWWGRSSARSELRELIGRAQTTEVSAPQPTPMPQPTTTTPQTNQTPQAIAGASWPFYMVVMVFMLAVGIEAAVFMYIYLRWSWRRWRWRDRSDRSPDFEDYIVRRLDKIEARLP